MDQPLRLTLRGSLEELAIVADAFDVFAAEHQLPADVSGAFQLAFEEIITNIIKYGYRGQPGPIRVEIALGGSDVIVSVSDAAPAFNPLELPSPRLDAPLAEKQPGGLGIHLVKALMDSVVYESTGTGNTITMRKRHGNH